MIDHFVDAYAIFQIKKYDRSVARREQSQSKVYVNDTGYATAYRPAFLNDAGQKLETLVLLKFMENQQEVFYFNRGRRECDFVITDRGEIIDLIQVCYELNDDNRKREIQGLTTAMKETGRDHGLLLTYNEEDRLDTEAGQIQVLPTWKWLLGQEPEL